MNDSYAVELIRVDKAFGDFVALEGVTLRIPDGAFYSLLGPSGCGKTTSLRLIAGFEVPTAGEVLIGGESMAGIPAHRRPVNTVFQSYALFPHLSVYENVAFGLEMRRLPREKIRPLVNEALEMVRLPGLEHRRPKQLSGGQQQRVALARALVNRPKVLLLDEPLGALDLKLRKAMQTELKALQERVGITFLYVTHDQEEALTMSDQIAVMSRGKVLQVGRPEEIYERPANRFVADFIGETNLLAGVVEDSGEMAGAGWQVVVRLRSGAVVRAPSPRKLEARQPVTVAIRPERLSFQPGGSWNAIDVTLEGRVYTGSTTSYQLRLSPDETLTLRRSNVGGEAAPVADGGRARVGWPPEAGSVFSDADDSEAAA